MHYQTYLKYKQLKEKLTRHFTKTEQAINQPVFIRDIHVYSTTLDGATGEAKGQKNIHADKDNTIKRYIDHIQLLAHTANQYHEHYYCEEIDGRAQIKPDCENHITRLSLNEFSLYPHAPFNLNTFSYLIQEVEAIARSQQENVHLLLSSIPVLSSKNEILNVCLYVQCGPSPKIESFAKSNPSFVDIAYGTKKFQQCHNNSNMTFTSHFIADSAEHPTISGNTVFTVETKGGARYVQMIDICFDHLYEHAKRLALYSLKTNTDITPMQANDLITSHIIKPIPTSRVSDSLTQIDHRLGKPYVKPMQDDTLTSEDMLAPHMKTYPGHKIEKGEKGFTFNHPPFGSDFFIVAEAEKPIGQFSKPFQPLVKHHNEQALEQQIDSQFKASLPKQDYREFSAITRYSKQRLKHLDTFYNELLHQCESGLFESLLNTQNHMLKREVHALVSDAYKTFKTLVSLDDGSIALLLNISDSLLDLKFRLKNLDVAIRPNFLQTCVRGAEDQARQLKNGCSKKITFD